MFRRLTKILSLCHFGPKWVHCDQIRCYYAGQNVIQSKLKLIKAEYELLKHQQPDQIPSKLDQSQLDYLLSLHKTKKHRRMTWLDQSYKLREQTLKRFRDLETFDGTNSLLFPLIGSEVFFIINKYHSILTFFLFPLDREITSKTANLIDATLAKHNLWHIIRRAHVESWVQKSCRATDSYIQHEQIWHRSQL